MKSCFISDRFKPVQELVKIAPRTEADFYLSDDVVFPKTVLLFKNGRSTNDTREQPTCPGSNQGDVITNEYGESPNQCVT